MYYIPFKTFLCDLGMKPHTYASIALETIIFSLYHFIVRPTKVIKGSHQKSGIFLENKVISKLKFLSLNDGLLVQYFSKKKNQKDSADFRR